MIYEVGKYYEVPIAYGRWGNWAPRWWVVNDSPLHEDVKFLGFQPWHLHVDARFLPKRYRDNENGVDVTFRWPLQWFFMPGSLHEELIRYDTFVGSMTADGRALSIEELRERIKLCTKRSRRKCLQEAPRWPRELAHGGAARGSSHSPERWQALHAEFDGRDAPGGICPHKGANLIGYPPDPDGLTTCPLHGARVRCTHG